VRLVSWLVLVALLSTAAAGVYALRGRVHRVDAVSFAFEPSTLTIDVGDRVEWTFRAAGHSVTAERAGWESGVRDAGESFARRFDEPGLFTYFCRQHDFMRGMILVAPKPRWREIWVWSLALVVEAAAFAAVLRSRRVAK
jgi:plastocyanin